MTRNITRAELARRLGVSRASITNAIKLGRISADAMTPDGQWLDPDRAAEQFRATSSREHRPALPRPAWSKPATPEPGPAAPAPPADGVPDRSASAARREAARAALAELQQLEAEGRLVKASDVQAEAFAQARQVRDTMLSLPDQLAQQLAAEQRPTVVHALLSDALRQALRSLATGETRAESLARRDQARADLAEMQAQERSGELIEAASATATWASVAAMVKTRLGAVPSQMKQRVPRLTLDEVETLNELIREALESIADGVPAKDRVKA